MQSLSSIHTRRACFHSDKDTPVTSETKDTPVASETKDTPVSNKLTNHRKHTEKEGHRQIYFPLMLAHPALALTIKLAHT